MTLKEALEILIKEGEISRYEINFLPLFYDEPLLIMVWGKKGIIKDLTQEKVIEWAKGISKPELPEISEEEWRRLSQKVPKWLTKKTKTGK